MKLTKAQAEALAQTIFKEVSTEITKEAECIKIERELEINKRLQDIFDSAKFKKVMASFDVIGLFCKGTSISPSLEVKVHNYNSGLTYRGGYDIEYNKENFLNVLKLKVQEVVYREFVIPTSICVDDIYREIMIQTIEIKDLDVLVDIVKNKFSK